MLVSSYRFPNASTNYATQNANARKTGNATATASNDENTPLTDDELALAKEYKLYLEFNSFLKNAVENGTLDKLGENEEFRAAVTYRKENNITCENVFKAIGMGIIDTRQPLYRNILERPNYNLPRQGFSFNAARNAATIGIGSKMEMGCYYLLVGNNGVGSLTNDFRPNPNDTYASGFSNYNSVYTHTLDCLLRAAENGNVSWRDNREMNDAVLALVKKMGIDTSRDFKINNTTFEVKNGIVQTKGYSPAGSEKQGFEYLNGLLARAYEQNLMYS